MPLEAAAAGGAAADKSGYHLFDPTPRDLMREMDTDRPDKTESPYTVDAGHFRIESDLVIYSHDHDEAGGADTVVDTWGVTTLEVRAGLTNAIDLQLLLDPHDRVTTEDRLAHRKTTQAGLGDLTMRLKMNFWGDDGGTTALGLVSFLKLPTNQDHLGNDFVEGGVSLPLAIELPAGFDLGLMTEVDAVRNDADTD